ncbi:MAG: hypothetical protein L0Z70_03580 [Chloroflexi bacterium]|nr:hypothetical protein [Chloroflexota bacterium]
MKSANSQRVLIASSHPLFGLGLRSLLLARQKEDVEVVGVFSNLEEATAALDELNPDLVILDHDDERLNREDFLARFLESGRSGETKVRVVVLTLQDSEHAVVYDRRTLKAEQMDDWLAAEGGHEIQDEGDADTSTRGGNL